MQERVVALLVIVLVVATTATAVLVNMLRPPDPTSWRSFDVRVTWSGTPTVGAMLDLNVTVRQGTVDPKTLWLVYLSLDVGTLQIASATPASNPWNYPTVWNLTSLDLTEPRSFTVSGTASEAGQMTVHAMIWVPRGDLRAVPIDATGHVNPAGVSLMGVDSQSFWVDATG